VGAYTFTVTQLARASQIGTNGFATADTAVNPGGPGSFDIAIGGVTKGTISVSTTDTLNTIAAAINAQDWGVTAVVVNSGEVGAPYKLVLTSDQTGTANAASIVNNITTNLTFGDLTVARNAQVQFGVDSPMTIESATNTITGLAPGLSLDLKAAAPGTPVTVTVTADSSGMLQKARDFVTRYNAVVDAVANSTKYDADKQVAAPLFGNSTLRFLSADLTNAALDPVTGQPDATNSLAMVGFKLGTDGKLALDEGVFSAALAAHPADVASLFSGISGGTEVGVAHRVSHLLESVTTTAGGVIANEQSSLDTRIADLTKSIEDMNARLDAREERLRAEFTAMETALAKMQQQSNYFLAQLNSLNSSK
jgi:flagellar hook-associated protein 2